MRPGELAVLLAWFVVAGTSGCEPFQEGAAHSAPAPQSANRLAESASPYLRMHADNPVAWLPWGEEAFRRAKREGKPIFLSIGYSSCHWCHVMEEESFQNEEIAGILNRHFVCIKVDREERPDIDEVYLTAVQLMTGQAGWPLSVFLTPEGKPFFGGTYFPPEDRDGLPGFKTVLSRVVQLWEERRQEVEQAADRLMRAVRGVLEGLRGPALRELDRAIVEGAVEALAAEFDPVFGGFGWREGAGEGPKFPQAPRLLFLADVADRNERARHMLSVTVSHLVSGGVYDHVGGGFHRYATDRRWTVPHFEKMLYDNGLLLAVLARARRYMDTPLVDRALKGTAAFLARELMSSEGAFFSSLDARSGGREGAYYVWTREELASALSSDEFRVVELLFGIDGPPVFEGAWVLRRVRTEDEVAAELGTDVATLRTLVSQALVKLQDVRARRPGPARDEKIISGWNGLAIAGLAIAARETGDEELVGLAERAAAATLTHLWDEGAGRLYRTRRPYGDDVPGTLNDYAFLAWGLFELADATHDPRWERTARRLVDEAILKFWDARRGTFWLVAEGHDTFLPLRPVSVGDGAIPAGSSVLACCLVRLAVSTGEPGYAEIGNRLFRTLGPFVQLAPQAHPMLVAAFDRFLAGSSRVSGGSRELSDEPVSFSVSVVSDTRGEAHDGGEMLRVRLTLRIADGWYVYAPGTVGFEGIPFRLEARFPEGYVVRSVQYPAGVPLGQTGDARKSGPQVWRGTKTIEVSIERESSGGRESLADTGRLVVTYQACTIDRCALPSRREIEVDLAR